MLYDNINTEMDAYVGRCISLKQSMWAEIERRAKSEDRTISNTISVMLRETIQHDQKLRQIGVITGKEV